MSFVSSKQQLNIPTSTIKSVLPPPKTLVTVQNCFNICLLAKEVHQSTLQQSTKQITPTTAKSTLMIKSNENSSNQTDCDEKEEKDIYNEPERRDSIIEEEALSIALKLDTIQENIETSNHNLFSTSSHKTKLVQRTSSDSLTKSSLAVAVVVADSTSTAGRTTSLAEPTTQNNSITIKSINEPLDNTECDDNLITSDVSSNVVVVDATTSSSPTESPRRKGSISSLKGRLSKTPTSTKHANSSQNLNVSTCRDNEDSVSKSSDTSGELIRASPSLDSGDKAKSTSRLSERAKKKSWYNVLYPNYKSRSQDFKKLFKEVPNDERLIVDYSCALQRDILVQGRLYVSQNYVCFHANIFRWETYLSIKWKDVTSITKEKTALVIPNAILICTAKQKYFFATFTSRDKAFLMLFRVWQNTLMNKQMLPQEMWQWVHKCYGDELGLTTDDEDYIDPTTVVPIESEGDLDFSSALDDSQILSACENNSAAAAAAAVAVATQQVAYKCIREGGGSGGAEGGAASNTNNSSNNININNNSNNNNNISSSNNNNNNSSSNNNNNNNNNSGNSSSGSGSGNAGVKLKTKSYFFNKSANRGSSTTTTTTTTTSTSNSGSDNNYRSVGAGGDTTKTKQQTSQQQQQMKANAKELTLTSARPDSGGVGGGGHSGGGNIGSVTGGSSSTDGHTNTGVAAPKDIKPTQAAYDSKRKVAKSSRHRDDSLTKNSEALPTDVSDSSDSDENKIPFVATAECTSTHEGRQLVHTILPINIETLFSMLFSKSKFLVDFHAMRKSTDTIFGDWTTNEEGKKKARQFNVTVQLAASVGPKTSKVTEFQEMRDCSKTGELYSIDINSVNAGIPYADSFSVLMHYCLVKTVDDHTMLSVHAQIKYKKSIWGVVKGFIEKNTWAGLEDFYTSLLHALQSETCIPPAKGKGRRPRRGTAVQIRPTEELPPAQTKIEQTENVHAAHSGGTLAPHLPALIEVLPGGETKRKYKWLSMFVVVLLGFLILLNVILLFKLWRLEDRIHDDLINRARMPNLSALKELPNTHQDWLDLMRQQEILHDTELRKWHKVLKTAVELLKKTEKTLAELMFR